MNNKEYYKKKYKKYKNKYTQLTKKSHEKYYFVHFTKGLPSLLNILKTGYVKAGKDVAPKYRFFGGEEGCENIYANINFESLNNISYLPFYGIIISPKIINTHNIIFNKGWGGGFGKQIIIKKTQNKKTKNKKIKKIHKWLVNPKLPKMIKSSEKMQHEILFDKSINIKKYVIGIICTHCTKYKIDKLKKALKKHPNIILIKQSQPMPKLNKNLKFEIIDGT